MMEYSQAGGRFWISALIPVDGRIDVCLSRRREDEPIFHFSYCENLAFAQLFNKLFLNLLPW